ncbi:sortase [Candidatus Microgenomates bacterium]|nr:sortase [Candidatus Microgenomates bacterium]
MPSTAVANRSKPRAVSRGLVFFGLVLLLSGLAIFVLTFSPVITQEVRYAVIRPDPKPAVIVPIDTNFGIVVPKIGANAKVVPNVDPYKEREYQLALTHGVAQARGTSFPGQEGNVFIFAHSAGNFYEANQYNAVFYLLDKLEKGDDIFLFYKGEKFKYQVTDKKIVPADAVEYFKSHGTDKTVTLMTCWPAGTTLKRLIIIAKLD